MKLKMRNFSLRIKGNFSKINSAFQDNAVGASFRWILSSSKLIFQSAFSRHNFECIEKGQGS